MHHQDFTITVQKLCADEQIETPSVIAVEKRSEEERRMEKSISTIAIRACELGPWVPNKRFWFQDLTKGRRYESKRAGTGGKTVCSTLRLCKTGTPAHPKKGTRFGKHT